MFARYLVWFVPAYHGGISAQGHEGTSLAPKPPQEEEGSQKIVGSGLGISQASPFLQLSGNTFPSQTIYPNDVVSSCVQDTEQREGGSMQPGRHALYAFSLQVFF